MTRLTAQEWGLYLGRSVIMCDDSGEPYYHLYSGFILSGVSEKRSFVYLQDSEKNASRICGNYKPILRDLSQMTDDEEKEYNAINTYPNFSSAPVFSVQQIDWLTRKGFAIRGEFERGVAVRDGER